jgi:uncharacterized protein
MDRIADSLDFLSSMHVERVTLLVIPDSGWDVAGLHQLKRWEDAGIDLAAHGWRHRCGRIEGPFHRFHSRFLSRNVAEHLSAGPDGVADIIHRSHDWFRERGLPTIPLYAPPAWAMGRIDGAALQKLPFRWCETLTGIWDVHTGRHRRLPLAGFEADTRPRTVSLSLFNRINIAGASASGRPLRIAIHPDDLSLGLAGALPALLGRCGRFLRYSDVMGGGAS